MSNYIISKVVSVSGERLEISLLDICEIGEKLCGVPSTMCVNIGRDSGPTPILIGQPGSFIKVALTTGELLSMIVDIQMKEVSSNLNELKEAASAGQVPIEFPKRIITSIPIGTISAEGQFERGSDVLPTVNSDVYAVLPETIDRVYESYAEGNFSFGKLSLLPEQDAKINLDSFLSRHAAILGQTGGGKSWTVASILQEIAEFPQSTVVLFDLHGEYKEAFANYADYIDANELELPYWLMNSEELLSLMVDRSESAAPNQIAKFKELLQNSKSEHPENIGLGIPKITIDTPVFFNFENIIDEFRRLDTEKVPGDTGKPKQGPLYGQFTRLLMRIDSRLNDKRYDLIFHPKKYNTSASMEELFRKILGKEKGNNKKITIVDLSTIPFDVRTSVISLILRCLFDFAYWHKKVYEVAHPIAVFCDEAHIYLNDKDPSSEPARISAERIAKEGRKYGISLTIISQRPREVSATILSQCNTFLCLRISNPDDQSYVKNLLPDSIKGITSIFSILRRGECVLLGDSVIMPTRIKINKPNPRPNSDDTSFYNEWNKVYEDIDFNKILDAWRKQRIDEA